MTADARLPAAPIDVVVMTVNAAHGAVSVVGKVHGQPLTAAQERLAHRERHAGRHKCRQGDERSEDDAEHESRVSCEREPGVARLWPAG